MVRLVQENKDWNCVQQLIKILGPLKEVTLVSSRVHDGSSMLAVYEFCVDSLEESHFYSDDDIHSNIQAALEQLVLYLHITNDWNNHDS